nr:hypothetical protein HK105_003869 [Polyrhizophydium stewartii]
MFRAPPPDAAAAAAFAAASAGAHTHDDLKDDLLLLACLALSFAAAWTLVLDRLLLVSASSIDAATRFLFSLTFATSCSLLLLVVLEVGDSFPESSRLAFWRLNLAGSLCNVVLLLPLYQIFVLASESRLGGAPARVTLRGQ